MKIPTWRVVLYSNALPDGKFSMNPRARRVEDVEAHTGPAAEEIALDRAGKGWRIGCTVRWTGYEK